MLVILYIFTFLGFLCLLGNFVDKSVGTLFRAFVDDKFGAFLHFLVYIALEWSVIVFIYADSLLSFVLNEFARLFELRTPCMLCTRIDHAFSHGSSSLYYNESVCEGHKKFLSSVAYCNAHKKLSDSRSMCQGCLLSFATERDYEFNGYTSIVGILHKDVDFFVEDEQKPRNKSLKKDEVEIASNEEIGILVCSCCGEPLKTRSTSKYKRSLSINAPPPSPQEHLVSAKNDDGGNVDLAPTRYAEVKLVSDAELELPEDEEVSNADSQGNRVDDTNEGAARTPSLSLGNKYFGTLLSEAAQLSPRLANRLSRKSTVDKLDLFPDLSDLSEADDVILNRLKRQVNSNRKSLKALYMELDEERSASAIAANNAMAMITRLQAEKAAVQMEALQYQRLKKEQAEYDKEAIQAMKDLLIKREEDIKGLEAELEMYKVKYGHIKDVGSEICEVDADEDYQDIKSQALSTFSEKSECGSTSGADQNENENSCTEHEGGSTDEPSVDYEGERSYLLGLLRSLEENANSPSDEGPNSSEELIEAKQEDESNKESTGVQNKAIFTRELSLIRERLRVIEADSGFLKHTAMTMQGEGEGTKLLTEIAQHLRNLRQPEKFPLETTNV